MKNTKILALLLSLVLLCGCLTACGTEEKEPEEQAATEWKQNALVDAYADKDYGFQLEAPAEGETVAIMHTNMGDISIRFFPEAAPKAVENFTTLARQGKYNGVTFHRVMNDFMIQGGDYENNNGTGGQSIWGSDFEDEFCAKLLNIRGSLSMANTGAAGSNSSQFFINQKGPSGKTAAELKAETESSNASVRQNYTPAYYEQMKAYYDSMYGTGYFQSRYYATYEDFYYGSLIPESNFVTDDAVWEMYAQYGGNMHLDGAWRYTGGHTVFGQVYAGMDVVDAIAAVETDSQNKPVASVIIESIDITTYTAADEK